MPVVVLPAVDRIKKQLSIHECRVVRQHIVHHLHQLVAADELEQGFPVRFIQVFCAGEIS